MEMDYLERREKKQQSNTINYLRAVAIILVVLHHAMSHGMKYLGEVSPGYSCFISIISFVHVPLFFMISGYLCHAQDVLKYYRKKFFQIFIPFLVCTSIKLVVNLIYEEFSHATTAGGEFLKAYIFGEYYWFSYALLVMCCIAPLLWKIKNKLILIGIILLLFAFNIVNESLGLLRNGGPFQIFNVLVFGIWFLLGYVLNQLNAGNLLNKKSVKHIAFLVSIAVSVLMIFLFAKGTLNFFISKFILSLSISYILLYIFSSAHFKIPLLNYISNYSYQIFLLDSFIKVVLFAVVSKLLSINLPIIILLAILNVFISIIICFIVRKIKLGKLLLGLS